MAYVLRADANSVPVAMPMNAMVGLSMAADQAIAWAIKKMEEESELDALCKDNPALAAAKSNYELVLALTKQHT